MVRWPIYPTPLLRALSQPHLVPASSSLSSRSAPMRDRSDHAIKKGLPPLQMPSRGNKRVEMFKLASMKQMSAQVERVPVQDDSDEVIIIGAEGMEEPFDGEDMREAWADYVAENSIPPTSHSSSFPMPAPPLPSAPPKSLKRPPAVKEAALKRLDPLTLSTTTALETQIRALHDLYPSALLLTQVGSFYESYFEQAPLIARLLGLKLTSKTFGKSSQKIRHSFSGFPLGGIEKALSTLVEAGHRVVVVDEVKDDGGKVVRREVIRIVTPGTGVDEAFVNKEEWNFVLSVGLSNSEQSEEALTLSYRDISTGSSFARNSSLSQLRDDLLVIKPKEIVLSSTLATTPLGSRARIILNSEQEREGWMISETDIPDSKSGPTTASMVLANYLSSTLLAHPPPVVEPTFVDPRRILSMDSTTLKSLEIKESLRGGTKGSLLWSVKRTVTPGGGRLLAERLCNPSTDAREIENRLALVQAFLHLSSTRTFIRETLKSLDDTSRSLQRLYMRRPGPAFHLLSLKRTLLGLRSIHENLIYEVEHVESAEEKAALTAVISRISSHDALATLIEESIDEEALMERTRESERRAELSELVGTAGAEKMLQEDKEGGEEDTWGRKEEWVIRAATSPELQQLHAELEKLRQEARSLENSLKVQYKNSSLAFKVAPKFGPVAHIATKSDGPLDKAEGVNRVTKTGSTRSYVLPDWTNLNLRIVVATGKIRDMETKKIQAIVQTVLKEYQSLSKGAELVDELDVALAFAELAQEMGLVRPEIEDSTFLNIVDGRHPTVEYALKLQARAFTANSLQFSHPSAFVHCLTGPNMAGKSTFLRQNALIVVLAQAGSFVPAEQATIGIVDRIFSRVGARDELDRDRSTFMVEMDEAAGILDNATERSMVLFDELGRGTSPLDGLAIAYAALEHLVHVNRSRTLFATHYHRLGELLGYNPDTKAAGEEWKGIEFWCTSVVENEHSVAYDHTVRRGLNDDSAGIIIAKLAKLPQRAIDNATMIRERVRGKRASEGGEM